MVTTVPTAAFHAFRSRLDRVIKSLDTAEAKVRSTREALGLLGLLEPHMPPELHAVFRATTQHRSGSPQQAVLEKYDAEVLTRLWQQGWSSSKQWPNTMEFHLIVFLSTLIRGKDSIDTQESGEVAVALVRLGVPEEDLIAVYETVYPELGKSAA